MNLRLLVLEQAYELVVLLDGFEWLDETVCPLELTPCTTPCTRRFCSTFTGMTKRSPRMVTSSSCSVPPSDKTAQIRLQRFAG